MHDFIPSQKKITSKSFLDGENHPQCTTSSYLDKTGQIKRYIGMCTLVNALIYYDKILLPVRKGSAIRG